jgi:cation:H+ antiporter
MIGFSVAIIVGLTLLVWSADRFILGAVATAKHLGMPTLLIGMVIVGFGTSAPEMLVSVIAAFEGNPGIALGNALGSNIANIGLILGTTALLAPIGVHSSIVRKELPILLIVSIGLGIFLWDDILSRVESFILFGTLILIMAWSVIVAKRTNGDTLEEETDEIAQASKLSLVQALIWLGVGLGLLILSSRILVWGAVGVAQTFGVSDLIIGLTIVALGTSLPELAASIAAVKKGEHDLALGNVVGSNLFNTLGVVGIAGIVAPMKHISPDVIHRDWPIMFGLSILLFIVAYGWKGRKGVINRFEGFGLLALYLIYNGMLIETVIKID